MTSRHKQTHLPGLPTITLNDHDEKASHRISSPYIVLLFIFYGLLFLTIKTIEDDLPSVIRERDIAKYDSTTFSEESARKYLHRILGDKPRVSGTIYHFVKTRDIKDLVDEISSRANLPVHTDWQYATGDYWLAFNSPHVNYYHNLSNIIAVLEGESGLYQNGSIGTSLLVNCHYDSVPFAMGASDNGVFCSAMAETLSKLSKRKKKLKHNIIFLFNGAEESVLLGSHAFLSHPWSKGVTNVVNLDSAGMNGKPSVFQVTDPRVLEVYRRTSYRPNAQGFGEMLFASGVIPSDTDFRIFRDFGDIHGIDIAFIKDGHVYHTRNDKPELIKPGVIQNAGNMLLSLLTELADSEELETKKPQSTLIYYDYIGLFLVTYTKDTALVVDLFVGILGLSSVLYFLWMFGFRQSSVKELIWSAIGRLICVVVGVIFIILLTSLMIIGTTQMRYLSAQWMVVPLYVLPFYIAMIFTSHLFDSWRANKIGLNRSIRSSQALSASRLLLSTFLLLMCCFPTLSNVRYLITVPLFVMSVASFVAITMVRYGRLKAWQHLSLEVFLVLPATAFTMCLSYRLIPLLVPIMGRSAADKPDYIIAVVTVVLATLIGITVSGIELLFSRRRLSLVLCFLLVICAGFMVAPLSPYRGDTTQRHYWFHTQITTYNSNFTPIENASGVLISKLDVNSVQSAIKAIKDSPLYVKYSEINNDSQLKNGDSQLKNGDSQLKNGDSQLKNGDSQLKNGDSQLKNGDSQLKNGDSQLNSDDSQVKSLKISDSDLNIISAERCEKYVYCDMPLYRPRFDRFNKDSLFITMDPPEKFEHSLKLLNKTCTEDTCVLNFTMSGPSYNTITIWPRHNITLSSWSFESPLKETLIKDNRKVYVIIHAVSTYNEDFETLEFSLNFTVPQSKQTDTLADISHHAHRIHHPEHFTPQYKMLLDVMPDYFNIATFLSFRSNYVF